MGRRHVLEETESGWARAGEQRKRRACLAQSIEGGTDIGPQRARCRLEVVDQQLWIGKRRGAHSGRRAQAPRQLLQLLVWAAEPMAVRFGEDVGGAEPAAAGQEDDRVRLRLRQALDPL